MPKNFAAKSGLMNTLKEMFGNNATILITGLSTLKIIKDDTCLRHFLK